VNTVNNDLTNWKVKLFLEKNSSFQNQFFYLNVNIPVDYPLKAPNIEFDSKFMHPNIPKYNAFLEILKNSW